MRALFTTNPGSGHWQPLVPFADALRAAGHEVAFATAPATCAAIAALGFRCFRAGEDERADEAQARHERAAALPGTEAAAWTIPSIFAGVWATRRLPDLLAICADWRPSLLVREDKEYAGCIAAERHALPHAVVQVTAWRPWVHELLVSPLNRLRTQVGLPVDPDLEMLYRYLFIVPGPSRFQDPATPLPRTTHAVRHVAFDRSGCESLPEWVHHLPKRPVVYATMGTAYNRVEGIHAAILNGLREEPIALIVTVGRDQDPADFGPQPPHIHLERYVPQSLLFPYCDLVINHGGSGTVMAALDHGLPMVIVPLAADQPDNARRCVSLGVARVVAADDRTPLGIRDAVRAVLRDPGYRRNAMRMREESERLPGPDHAVAWLERLASDRQPLVVAS